MPKTEHPVDHRAEALRLLGDYDEVTGSATSLLLAASVHSNLAIAEGQERVAEAVRAGAPTSPRGVENGDLARWILDALEQPADDPSNTEASLMQARIDTAIRGWFDV